MKEEICQGCNEIIEVFAEYEAEWCCDGWKCGCRGRPVNPVFCDECEKKILGEPTSLSGSKKKGKEL